MTPAPRLIKTPEDAEVVACEWLRYWGFDSAELTPRGADGGLDVVSTEMAAQVKLQGTPIDRPTIQKLQGAAAGRIPVFFSLSGYVKTAIEWSEEHEIALFEFDWQGEPKPVNSSAEVLASGRGSKAKEDRSKTFAPVEPRLSKDEEQIREAEMYLEAALANGAVASKIVEEIAREKFLIKKKHIEEARKRLGVLAYRTDNGIWILMLPRS